MSAEDTQSSKPKYDVAELSPATGLRSRLVLGLGYSVLPASEPSLNATCLFSYAAQGCSDTAVRSFRGASWRSTLDNLGLQKSQRVGSHRPLQAQHFQIRLGRMHARDTHKETAHFVVNVHQVYCSQTHVLRSQLATDSARKSYWRASLARDPVAICRGWSRTHT